MIQFEAKKILELTNIIYFNRLKHKTTFICPNETSKGKAVGYWRKRGREKTREMNPRIFIDSNTEKNFTSARSAV